MRAHDLAECIPSQRPPPLCRTGRTGRQTALPAGYSWPILPLAEGGGGHAGCTHWRSSPLETLEHCDRSSAIRQGCLSYAPRLPGDGSLARAVSRTCDEIYVPRTLDIMHFSEVSKCPVPPRPPFQEVMRHAPIMLHPCHMRVSVCLATEGFTGLSECSPPEESTLSTMADGHPPCCMASGRQSAFERTSQCP